MKQSILDPIHAPCPDMAGCVNFDPSLTEKSSQRFAEWRAKFFGQSKQQTKAYIPARFRYARPVDYRAEEDKVVMRAMEIIAGRVTNA
ncbi:hypothetical protein RB980_000386 [Vibrio fluvialis]|nr:hypothetical protein [Vibrio fluvialis]